MHEFSYAIDTNHGVRVVRACSHLIETPTNEYEHFTYVRFTMRGTLAHDKCMDD